MSTENMFFDGKYLPTEKYSFASFLLQGMNLSISRRGIRFSVDIFSPSGGTKFDTVNPYAQNQTAHSTTFHFLVNFAFFILPLYHIIYCTFLERGVVIKSTGSWYTVKSDDGLTVECRLKGRLRTEGVKSTSPAVVGDVVLFDFDTDRTSGIICDMEPRKNYIIRKSANLSKQSHIIAANVDRAFLAVTFRLPKTPSEFIDRFLVAAEAYRIPVCLVFNKTDLYSANELEQLRQIESVYRSAGYHVIETSVTNMTGIGELGSLFQAKTSVIAGLSGTGKSSLINAVDPGIKARTGDMSMYHKSGKHTTTYAEMFQLNGGGYIIDTPGIRGFGLINIEKEELYHFFPEIFKMSQHCSFHNCRHVNEPGCAVTEAVETDKISAFRYRNYLNMMRDAQNKYR
jgi:ribosome biogenesis GTPase